MKTRAMWTVVGAGIAATVLTGALVTGTSATGAERSVPNTPASALNEDGLTGVKSRAELEQIDVLFRAGARPPELSKILFQREGAHYLVDTSYFENRTQEPQMHLQQDEVFVVMSGAAKLRLGGELVNKKEHGDPNEYRGTAIKGGITQVVAAGDVISAPRGIPHQFDPGVGHINYMVVKINYPTPK